MYLIGFATLLLISDNLLQLYETILHICFQGLNQRKRIQGPSL